MSIKFNDDIGGNANTCGMMVLKSNHKSWSWSPMLLISTPLIKILPPALSKIQNKAKARDDFSANV